jgi:competence protein ComEA
MDSFTKREQIGILVIVLIIVLGLGFKFFTRDIIKLGDDMEVSNNAELESHEDIEDDIGIDSEETIIMVHISGQVYKPGLVELEAGQRLIDAVELAGGLRKDADIDRINLAKKLVDEEKIYIPEIGEDLSEEINTLNVNNLSNTKDTSGKININTCTKESLISLPGIGEGTASKIIEYRESNPFKTIEDIKNVSGIGNKKFDAIKELIIVN